ncbi:MAG: hypothetical protein FWC87_01180 [Acidimicrobiaceae bacterium]|nr:hypothetical protein [Acidimicrobiaceae bacterium]
MSDGAHLGVNAERALETVLGGAPQPAADERQSVEDMRTWLLEAGPYDEATEYGEAARCAGGAILRWALENPERFASTEGHDLYDSLVAEGIRFEGISGFMWGWAENAARRCLDLPPKPNPAIVEIP